MITSGGVTVTREDVRDYVEIFANGLAGAQPGYDVEGFTDKLISLYPALLGWHAEVDIKAAIEDAVNDDVFMSWSGQFLPKESR